MTASNSVSVAIRTPAGYEYVFDSGVELKAAAYRWTYVLRNRNRWHNDTNYRQHLEQKCFDELKEFGLTESQIRELAGEELLEISISYLSEELGWEARIMPWEFLIAEGTRKAGRQQNIAIIRHIDRPGRVPTVNQLNQAVFLTAAPGQVNRVYDFRGEKSLVYQSAFQCTDSYDKALNFNCIDTPDISSLEESITTSNPEIVHVAGVDAHQANHDFGIHVGDERETKQDGVILPYIEKGPNSLARINPTQLAKTLNASERKPALVFFNIFYSAARIASLAVAEGAGASIGFQDQIDDQVAENFIDYFYDSLSKEYSLPSEQETSAGGPPETADWNIRRAFLSAFELLRRSDIDLKGSGIVLWSAKSIWDDDFLPQELLERGRHVASLIEQEEKQEYSISKDGGLNIEVQPKERLNFALLHNRQPIFDRFEIRKNRGRMKSVRVNVELHIGSERPKFTRVLDLNKKVTHLDTEIFFPLTWMRTELFWESVLISAQVDITWQGATLYSQSHPITMDPADDWVDTDENRQSLPSFVYPRDPTVSKIINSAQEVLFGIADDYTAGFDGYQSIDLESKDDPYERVDAQVQAIWTSLVRSFKLSYINPPPSFSEFSQRIRTPEEVIDGRRGTCIDLTMLLASCLEYVEIYPVIFLLEGHAFPGYWRSDTAHEAFIVPTSFRSEDQSPSVWQHSPWLVGENSYQEVLEQIHNGNIVPLESVWLTQNAGFWEAVEQGWENMRIASEFHSLIDIRFARNNNVTPLPIRSLRD